MNNREIINQLTVIDEKDKSSIVFSIMEGIKRCTVNLCEDSFQLGAYLLGAKAFRVWQTDGSQAKNFGQWLENEVGLKKTVAYNAIDMTLKLYPIISTRPELSGIFPSRLVRLLPYIKGKNEDQIVELLHQAKDNSCRDLEDNLRKSPRDECQHVTETWVMEKCTKCHATVSMNKMVEGRVVNG